MRTETRSDQFRKMDVMAERQMDWFSKRGHRHQELLQMKEIHSLTGKWPRFSFSTYIYIFFYFTCSEDLFLFWRHCQLYNADQRQTSWNFNQYPFLSVDRFFRNISILVTGRNLEGTQMCIKSLSPFLGLSNRTEFQKNHVILHSRQCFEVSMDETLALYIHE